MVLNPPTSNLDEAVGHCVTGGNTAVERFHRVCNTHLKHDLLRIMTAMLTYFRWLLWLSWLFSK